MHDLCQNLVGGSLTRRLKTRAVAPQLLDTVPPDPYLHGLIQGLYPLNRYQ